MVRYVNKINKTLEQKQRDFNQKFGKQPTFFKIRKRKSTSTNVETVPTLLQKFALIVYQKLI